VLDFTPEDWDEDTETLTNNVVTGTILVYGELDSTQHGIDDIDVVTRRTLGAICEHKAGTSAPVLVTRYQDIKTVGTATTGLNYTFTLLSADGNEATKECMGQLAAMSYGPWKPPYEELGLPVPALRKFFAIQLASNYKTRNLDSANWGLSIQDISCSKRAIIRTKPTTWDEVSITTTTSAAEEICDGSPFGLEWDAENTNGFDPGHVSRCNLAGSNPCICASLPKCEWMPTSGTCQATPNPGVSCASCGWQRKCWAPSQNESCTAYTTACDCARAHEGFTWKSGTCIGKSTWGVGVTSCVDCPAQTYCSLPSVVKKSPPKGSMLGIDGWVLELDFDRPMVFAEKGATKIWLSCRSYDETPPPTFQLEESRVKLAGSKLSLDMEGLQNDAQRDCDVIIQSKVLYGQMSGLPYPGMSESEYTVFLPDTTGPAVVAFEPENSARAVPLDTKVIVHFSEELRLGPGDMRISLRTVGANPVEQLIPMTAAGGVTFSGNKMTLDLSGRLNSTTTYTVAIPQASLRDALGNNFTGLATEIYSFGTVQASMVVAERKDDLTGVYVALSVLGAIALLAVSIAVAALRHFQKSVRARAKVFTESRKVKAKALEIDITNLEDLEAADIPVSPVTPVAPLPLAPPRQLRAGASSSNPPSDRSSRPSSRALTVASTTESVRQPWRQVGSSTTLAKSAATSKTMSVALSNSVKPMKPQPAVKASRSSRQVEKKANLPTVRFQGH